MALVEGQNRVSLSPVAINPDLSSHRIDIDLEGAPIYQYVEHRVRIEVRADDAKHWAKPVEIPLDIAEPLGDIEWPSAR